MEKIDGQEIIALSSCYNTVMAETDNGDFFYINYRELLRLFDGHSFDLNKKDYKTYLELSKV